MGNILKVIKSFLEENESAILTGVGLTGLVISEISAVAETPAVLRDISEKKKELGKEKLTPYEIFTCSWKHYIFPFLGTLVSGVCIICSDRIDHRKQVGMAAMCTMAEATLQDFQAKSREILGEKKAREISDAVDKKNIEEHHSETKIVYSGSGTIFMEPITHREFESDWQTIVKTCNDMTTEALRSGFLPEIDFDDWLWRLGAGDIQTDEYLDEYADYLGLYWDQDTGWPDISTGATHVTKDGKICVLLKYGNKPKLRSH